MKYKLSIFILGPRKTGVKNTVMCVGKKVLDTGVPRAYNAPLFLSRPERFGELRNWLCKGLHRGEILRDKSRYYAP